METTLRHYAPSPRTVIFSSTAWQKSSATKQGSIISGIIFSLFLFFYLVFARAVKSILKLAD